MNLDLHTLETLSVVVGVVLTTNLAIIARLMRDEPGLGPWVAAAACVTAGVSVLTQRAHLPEAFVVLAGNGLLGAGFALGWSGTRHYCGLAPLWRPVGLGVAALLLSLGWFVFAVPDPRMRVLIFAGHGFCWSLASGWTFLRRGPHEAPAANRLLAAALLLPGLINVPRLISSRGDVPGAPASAPDGPLAFAYVGFIVFAVTWQLALVVLLNRRLQRRLHLAARTDALTGALNRGAMEEDGRRAVGLCRRKNLPFAVLLFDLDEFKRLNDTFGHAAGDAALRHFAELVARDLRPSDLFARYGGEEFCVLMPGAGRNEALAAAERLRARLALAPPAFDGRLLPLTVSAGMAAGQGAHLSLGALLRQADGALYEAKRDGRDRVRAAALTG